MDTRSIPGPSNVSRRQELHEDDDADLDGQEGNQVPEQSQLQPVREALSGADWTMSETLGQKRFECTVQGCPAINLFMTKRALNIHRRAQHDLTKIKNCLCPYLGCSRATLGFPTLSDVRMHMSAIHHAGTRQLFDCQDVECNKKGALGFRSRANMRHHMASQHNVALSDLLPKPDPDRSWVCQIATCRNQKTKQQSAFRSSKSLRDHYYVVHQRKLTWTCSQPDCYVIEGTFSELKRHRKLVHGIGSYTGEMSDEPGDALEDDFDVTVHGKAESPRKSGPSLKHKQRRKQRQRQALRLAEIYPPKRQFPCLFEDCTGMTSSLFRSSYSTKHSLRNHMIRAHPPPAGLYSCAECDHEVKFNLQHNLHRHLVQFHGIENPSSLSSKVEQSDRNGIQELQRRTDTFECRLASCGRKYLFDMNLLTHLITDHNKDEVQAHELMEAWDEPACTSDAEQSDEDEGNAEDGDVNENPDDDLEDDEEDDLEDDLDDDLEDDLDDDLDDGLDDYPDACPDAYQDDDPNDDEASEKVVNDPEGSEGHLEAVHDDPRQSAESKARADGSRSGLGHADTGFIPINGPLGRHSQADSARFTPLHAPLQKPSWRTLQQSPTKRRVSERPSSKPPMTMDSLRLEAEPLDNDSDSGVFESPPKRPRKGETHKKC